jgi:hypothetical protein
MDVSSIAFEGINRALERLSQAAGRLASGPPEPEDMVELSLADLQMAASIKALKAGDEMQRRIVDLLG